jgi:hypothetical protein
VVTAGRSDPPRRLLRGSEQLQQLLGRHLLAGVTIRDAEGRILQRRQFHGPVTAVADGVVVLRQADGTEAVLPADPAAYEPARPGTYRLASGDVVVDPDFLSTWDVVADES